jgi:hypothetical protein
MGYKILGYVVWHAGKWYVRRRAPHLERNVALAAGTVLLLGGAGVAVASRRGRS